MTNDNFQEIVLSELRGLKDGQVRVEERLTKVEDGLSRLGERQTSLEDGMSRFEARQTSFEKKLDVVYNQTVRLSEYNTEINSKLSSINAKVDSINAKVDNLTEDFKSIHAMIGEHEVSIRTLRRIDFDRRKEYYEAMSKENEAMIRENSPIDELK